jgi:hypothetical protein
MRGVGVRAPRRPASRPAARGIRFWWRTRGRAGLTLERVIGDRVTSRRELGPRGRLDLDEAAAVLERSVDEVRGEIRAGFLQRVRGSRPMKVTIQALAAFLEEERADVKAAQRADARIRSGCSRLVPWSEVRRRLA